MRTISVKIRFLICFLFIASFAIGQPIVGRTEFTETDGSPSVWPYKVSVSNGSLTDNGDGTASLATGGSGQAISLDLTDDDVNESVDLGEIAITNDTNSIFTEPSADKLLIDVSQNWPTADAAPASGITGTDAGTDLTADLEEETHASEHEDGAADEIAVTPGMMNAGTDAAQETFFRGDGIWTNRIRVFADDHYQNALELDFDDNNFNSGHIILGRFDGAFGRYLSGYSVYNEWSGGTGTGTTYGYMILRNDRDAARNYYGMMVGPQIHPIQHFKDGFSNVGFAWDYDDSATTFTDITGNLNGLSDTAFLQDTNDILYIGSSANFSGIYLNLRPGSEASADLDLKFEFSSVSSTWTEFWPLDGSKGMTQSSIIWWDENDITGSWTSESVNGETRYWVRITRQEGGTATDPIEDRIHVTSGSIVEYGWDEDGNVDIAKLTANAGVEAKNGTTSAGWVDIYEDSDDGTEKTRFIAQAQAADITYTLPPDDGDAGEQLQTDGSGNLTWESAGAGGSGDSVTVNSTAIDTTANFLDNIYVDFVHTDGGAGGPDDVTAKPNFNAATGDHALSANEGAFAANGFVFEGATADTIETYFQVTDPTSSDKTLTFPNATDTIVGRDTTDTLTNKTINTASNTITINEADISDLQSYLLNVVEDTTPQLGGELDAQGNNIIDLADVTFRTGASGGTLRTGTSSADKFVLQAYDVDGATYLTMLTATAGNTPLLDLNHVTDMDVDAGGAIRSDQGAGDTMLIQAYDVDGAAYTTFATLTANNTPTMDLDAAVTIGGNSIITTGDSGTVTSTMVTNATLVDADMANDALDPDKLVGDATDDDLVDEDIIEDRFIKNHSSDTMTGTLTADGLTLGANENITLGAQTLDHDGTDFVFSDTISVADNIKFTGTNPKKRIFLSATAGLPRTTNGCADAVQSETTTNKINYMSCAFADDADDFWQSSLTLPENYDGGTFTGAVEWVPDSDSTSGGVSWFIQLMSISDDDSVDTAFGTAIEVNDDWTAAGDFLRTAESAAITASGSPAGGDRLWIQVYRDVDDADDDLAGGASDNANFVGVWLTFGIDALSTED